MVIASEIIGTDKSNRNMLIAQAAIRGLVNPETREQAIEQAKRNMADIKRGLESGDYKFFVDTAQRSNLSDKQTAPMIVLKGKEGSTLASMQPAPIRSSLSGSDVHKKHLTKMSKEKFGKWAVRQINAGTVDHTKVVDWLTVNNRSSITLSETTQWFETPLLDIPISIPNEDYTYELVNHMGKKQWFVTKDGGERVPVRASFDVDALKPADTVKYVYTGAEGRISRRTGVTTVAGKPLIMFEWKGMGTKWMLDSSRYDTTQTTTQPSTNLTTTQPSTKQEREWENFIRTNIESSIETQRLLNTVIESLGQQSEDKPTANTPMALKDMGIEPTSGNVDEAMAAKPTVNRPMALRDMGTEPTSGDFNAALAVKPFVRRDGKPTKYITTIANTPVVLTKDNDKVSIEMPEVKERETTTGTIDIKDTYVYGGDGDFKFTYMKLAGSDQWLLFEGPSLNDADNRFADKYEGIMRLPSWNKIAQELKKPIVLSPPEKYFAATCELQRLADMSGNREKKIAVLKAWDRSVAFFKEYKRLEDQPEMQKVFGEYIDSEMRLLLE